MGVVAGVGVVMGLPLRSRSMSSFPEDQGCLATLQVRVLPEVVAAPQSRERGTEPFRAMKSREWSGRERGVVRTIVTAFSVAKRLEMVVVVCPVVKVAGESSPAGR